MVSAADRFSDPVLCLGEGCSELPTLILINLVKANDLFSLSHADLQLNLTLDGGQLHFVLFPSVKNGVRCWLEIQDYRFEWGLWLQEITLGHPNQIMDLVRVCSGMIEQNLYTKNLNVFFFFFFFIHGHRGNRRSSHRVKQKLNALMSLRY